MLEPREWRRDLAGTLRVNGIVAEPTRGKGPPATAGEISGCSVDGQEGEGDRVAEFHVPTQEPVLRTMGADVGHVLQRVRLVIVGDAAELLRPEPAAPAVGSRHELDADVPRHRIE